MGSDSTLLFSLHPTPGIGGRKPYPPGQSPGARGTSLALQESSVKCTELQENWQFWKEMDELGMQLQKEKASSQHLETLNEGLEEDLEQWFNIIHTLRAHRAGQEYMFMVENSEIGEKHKKQGKTDFPVKITMER
ncbi:Protein Daple [Myotis davidii]|uniref:Protein Daple n=1 Tax=Myotis davidii TaxID=225400 RepID=L5M1I8_MYODS|nr:Protein Daple [Myotis davidii]